MSLEMKDTYDRIYRYCFYRLRNATYAEDITQETFLKYFAQNIQISSSEDMAYLYTIARNLCIDCYRKKTMEELDEEYPGEDFTNACVDRVAVFEAMNHLDEKDRELLILRYLSELSVGEVAQILEISRFAVYRREKDALSKMKKYLKGAQADDGQGKN